jgi:hypothetical protein
VRPNTRARRGEAVDHGQVEIPIAGTALVDDRAGPVDEVQAVAEVREDQGHALGDVDHDGRGQLAVQRRVADPRRAKQALPVLVQISTQDVVVPQVAHQPLDLARRQPARAPHGDLTDGEQAGGEQGVAAVRQARAHQESHRDQSHSPARDETPRAGARRTDIWPTETTIALGRHADRRRKAATQRA